MRDPKKLIRPDLEQIPYELTKRDRWIPWKLVKKKGKDKLDKVPCSPSGHAASITEPKNWMSFEDVCRIYKNSNGKFSGVGFVPAGLNKIIGVDFDSCVNGDGQPSPERLKEIQTIYSYSEISPSGTGVRVFAFGDIPTNGKKDDDAGVEIYKNGRFLTVTGQCLPGMPADVEDSAGAILDLYNRYFGNNTKADDTDTDRESWVNILMDDLTSGKDHDALVSLSARLVSKGVQPELLYKIGPAIIKGAVNQDKHERRLKEWPGMIESAVIKYGQTLPVKPFTFKKVSELEVKAPDWIVEDTIESDTLAQIFGDPGCGKSFAAIDLACCVATGKDFHGHKTKQGAVCYIAGEGQNGLARRFAAWAIRNDVDLKTAPLFISTVPAALCDADQARQVLDAVEKIISEHGNLKLIVIDTLARNFGPGDENSTKDMGGFIQAADALRACDKSTVLLIHHTGHSNKERARGAIALPGALDAHYRMDKDKFDIIRFEPIKMKDAEKPEPMAFEIRTVELGIKDENGVPVTSAILDDTEYEARTENSTPRYGKWQKVGIEALSELERLERDRLKNSGQNPNTARVTLDDWKTECVYRDMDRRRFYEIKQTLSVKGEIVIDHGFVGIP